MVNGLDCSFSRISPQWAQERLGEGWKVFVQCLWTGGYLNNPAIRSVAELNLRDARDAGMIISGYINANPWFPASESIREAKKNAGATWHNLDVVFVDVEIPQTTLVQVRELCEALKADGKRVSIYSARWFWKGTLGNPTDPWLLEYPLWNAFYDNSPDIDFPANPYGPWNSVIGEQYQNTTNLGNVNVDLNVFEDSFFSGGGSIPIQEDDMILLQAPTRGIWILDASGVRGLQQAEVDAYRRAGVPLKSCSDADIAAFAQAGGGGSSTGIPLDTPIKVVKV